MARCINDLLNLFILTWFILEDGKKILRRPQGREAKLMRYPKLSWAIKITWVTNDKSVHQSQGPQVPYTVILWRLSPYNDLDYSLQVNNWCSDMKHIFSQLNMEDTFRSKSKINLETFRRKITEMHSVNWSDSVQNVSKLRTYRTFKTTFSQEKYLTTNLSKVERSHFLLIIVH